MRANTCSPSEDVQTDRQLIDTAIAGDQSGYEELVRRYSGRLLTAIRCDVGCPTIADDVVQEAFARAFLHLDSFRHQSNFYTWLYRIALNCRRNYLRTRQRNRQLDEDGEGSVLRQQDSRDTPPVRLQRAEDRNQVSAALDRLDDHHRTILILREFEGMDYQSIAEALSVNKGTVRSRLSRARARLRKELVAYHTRGVATVLRVRD